MIDRAHDLPISQQAAALNISRGSIYYLPRAVPEADLAIMRTTLEHRARVTVSPADWAGESFCIEWLILPWAVRESGERRFLA